MDDLLPQVGLVLLLIGLGLPVFTWFLLRFPLTSGALGLVGAVLELLRILGEPGQAVRPTCVESTPPAYAAPREGFNGGNGLRGPELRL